MKEKQQEEDVQQSEASSAEPTKRATSGPVSERKLRANRANAKKSTGPKTARGKRNSSFNAVTHGLLARKVMFSSDGKLVNEDLQHLFENLRDSYGRGDLASEILAELAIIDYWRLEKGLEYELKYLNPQGGEFHPQGGMPTLMRYQTASRRAFDKSLQMLMKMPKQRDSIGKDDDSSHSLDVSAAASGENP